MTNEERREFEEHKKRAEKQLNDMYMGNGQKSLTMPPFLRGGNQSTEKPQKQELSPDKSPSPAYENKQKNKLNLLELLNFKNIALDNDRIIILALCLLLSSEEADELLILALIYIML